VVYVFDIGLLCCWLTGIRIQEQDPLELATPAICAEGDERGHVLPILALLQLINGADQECLLGQVSTLETWQAPALDRLKRTRQIESDGLDRRPLGAC
jgi:hypothetical protein